MSVTNDVKAFGAKRSPQRHRMNALAPQTKIMTLDEFERYCGGGGRPRPEKKREPAAPVGRRVLPMQFQIGDRLVDETGEWEVASRPYVTNAGKDAYVRIKKVGQPEVIDPEALGRTRAGQRTEAVSTYKVSLLVGGAFFEFVGIMILAFPDLWPYGSESSAGFGVTQMR